MADKLFGPALRAVRVASSLWPPRVKRGHNEIIARLPIGQQGGGPPLGQVTAEPGGTTTVVWAGGGVLSL